MPTINESETARGTNGLSELPKSGGVLDWLDARTGYRDLLRPLWNRELPNGPGWWLTSASCLFWLLVVQIVTGFLLMTTYSPSTTSAWASVHFIEQTSAGTFIRGMHHFASHAMIVLFAVHIVRVLVTGAFRAPRELIWITGLFLMPLMIIWAVTGNPLSASQKGMAQIEVEANILGSTPGLGPILKRLLLGGDEVGHLTLTHLYFLHVGLIPLGAFVLLTLHITQVYRHGPAPSSKFTGRPSSPYWPHQSLRNFSVLAALLAAMGFIAWKFGAPLEAPADPNLPNMPRPEWYFRSLFELRRYFTGDWEFVATMIVPAVVLAALLAIPVLDYFLPRRVSGGLRICLILALFGGWSGLTAASYWRDWNDSEYKLAQQQSRSLSARARALADQGSIPPEGAITLLRGDYLTQGPLLFTKHCSACHSCTDSSGEGIVAESPSASNLYGFGTTDWIAGWLDPDRIKSDHYFGRSKFESGEMVNKVEELYDAAQGDARIELAQELKLVAQVLAVESGRLSHIDDQFATELDRGRGMLSEKFGCIDCHKFHEQGELGSGPDLTGYGSDEWLTAIISDPKGARFYAGDRNDRMPSFASDSAHPEQNLLSRSELTLLVRWLKELH